MMCGVPLPIATEVIRGVAAWNGVDAFALCSIPTLLLRARLDEDLEDVGCARSGPTWRSASRSEPATSTSSRCPIR